MWKSFLFALSFTALLHLFVDYNEAILAVDQGRGGGYIGLFLSYAYIVMEFH